MTRARDLGIPFDGTPGPLNAITDVPGVEVGHATLIDDGHARANGGGRIRTGVTVIHPRSRTGTGGVAAGRAVLNGTGEWTGMHLVDEIGRFHGPIALTGSGSVGIVHHAVARWAGTLAGIADDERTMRLLAVIGETLDAPLHDVFAHALAEADVVAALDGASAGPVAEGNVGGGTGMIAYEFKGGIGTASRRMEAGRGHYTMGALVQANHGRREDLIVAGIRVGAALPGSMPGIVDGGIGVAPRRGERDKNSLLMVLATDAPLLPHQLRRVARRAALGVGRCGGVARNLSGEMALAFATGDAAPGTALIDEAEGDTLSALFEAAVQAIEEALVNQLVASVDMVGNGNLLVHGLPHGPLTDVLRRHGRLD